MKNKIILLYHEVANNATESGFQNKDNLPYIHSIEGFRRDVEIVKEMLKNITSEVIFSFDDGGVSNLRASNILQKAGFNGYFFITTSKIGHKCFLNKDEIIQIANQGHIIGSHSHTHPMIFKNLSYKQMLKEWKESKQILENILGHEINSCSVPGGDSDKKTYESALDAGFLKIFDSEPIIKQRKLDKLEILGRISIKNTVTEKRLQKILTLDALPSIQRERKIKNWIKSLIFPLHNYLQNRKNEFSY